MKKTILRFINKIAFRYTKFGAPGYPYNLEPIQLATLINEMERLRDEPGCIIEIGVARGMTTRFLAEHVKYVKRKETIHAIDTFSSFPPQDVDYEVNVRGKKAAEIEGFGYNDFEIWKNNFKQFPFVTAHQADCSGFDYSTIKPIKLVFLDVDLYKPTKAALEKIFPLLSDNGVILVDDVADKTTYDGAYQAYMEFCRDAGVAPHVIGNKCGVIRKGNPKV